MLARNRSLVPPPITGADGLPIPERELELSDGERVTYVDVAPAEHHPGQPVVLMIPGADGVKETFRFQAPVLCAHYRVVCATLRSGLEEDHTLDRLVADTAELCETIGVESLVLVGQSLGGAIAMRFAVLHPDRVQGLVIANSLARVSYEHVGLNRTLLTPVASASTRYLPTWLGKAMARLWSRLEVWIYDASPGSERVVDYALWTGGVRPRQLALPNHRNEYWIRMAHA